MVWNKIILAHDENDSANSSRHQYLYHVSPAGNHDSILANGLVAQPNADREGLSAIWAFDNLRRVKQFYQYPKEPLHIWRIDASHYPQQDDWWWRKIETLPSEGAHILEDTRVVRPEHLELIGTIDPKDMKSS